MGRLLIALLVIAMSTGCASFDKTKPTRASMFPTPEFVTEGSTTASGEIKTSLGASVPAAYSMTASKAVFEKGGAWCVAAPVTIAYDVVAGTAVSAGRVIGAVAEDTIRHPIRNTAIGGSTYLGGAYLADWFPFKKDDKREPREPTAFMANGERLQAGAEGFDFCRFSEERNESDSGKTEFECGRHQQP